MSDVSLKGVIDMHVHSNPDIRHRAYDDFELMEAAIRTGARAIVIKTHQGTTVDVFRDGKVVPELKDVFQLIKDFDVVLGTGHISPEECFRMVEAARDAGVKKIVVTHPEWWLVGMSLEDQIRIVKDYNVILEHCFAQPMGGGKYKSNLPMNLEAIKACGYKNVMVSTDGGQVENPNWEIALAQYIGYLADNGISRDEIHYMTHTIQSGLLGLED